MNWQLAEEAFLAELKKEPLTIDDDDTAVGEGLYLKTAAGTLMGQVTEQLFHPAVISQEVLAKVGWYDALGLGCKVIEVWQELLVNECVIAKVTINNRGVTSIFHLKAADILVTIRYGSSGYEQTFPLVGGDTKLVQIVASKLLIAAERAGKGV